MVNKCTKHEPIVTEQDLLAHLSEVRPTLHRFCTRITGSVFDGEDLVQATLLRAYQALAHSAPINDLLAWLLKLAHNLMIDNHRAVQARPEGHMVVQEPIDIDQAIHNAALDDLDWLMTLPPIQRSVLILNNGFGYSAQQSATLLHTTEDAIKSALARARGQLKHYMPSMEKTISDDDTRRLKLYTELFNQRKFDDLLALTIDEIKLDMVAKAQLQGKKDIQFYFSNYNALTDWHAEPGMVEGKPAMLVFEPAISKTTPQYVVLLEYAADALKRLQDFRYARYVMESAKWQQV
ncbi:RNA polymerase sigma factor [Pseudoalteromonas sp. T1lg23B]|uniref:RNA polymerase sigma factor n=1 Tax=Pseudoalteromonas sp. T1lg23B TaxID=2077097 RepID=UPI00131A3C35|nr:RNA polymerase sigma factor [Pseudoalteromonas sp. T1lg23B]